MSEFSPEQDELASAYLDGAATVEEQAVVDRDPALLSRVDQLRAVRDALAEPVVGPTAAERDAAIRAALGASQVVSIDVARGQRRLRIASVAAAIVVVLGAAGILIRAADNSNTTKFTAVANSIGSATDRSPSPEAAGTAGGGAGGGGTAAGAASTIGRPPLGTFTDRSALAAAAQTQVHSLSQSKQMDTTAAPAPNATTSPTTTAPSCLVPPPADAANEVYAATAVLEGHLVQVDVFTIVDGSLTLVVTDAATCAQVFSQPV